MQISEPRQLAHKQVSFIVEHPDGAAPAYFRMYIKDAIDILTEALEAEFAKMPGGQQMVTIDFALRDQ
jgi:hypothetical protein